MKEDYALSDIGSEGAANSRTQLHDPRGETPPKPRGCHVTPVVGLILLLLAVLVAVGVGLIVHFASPGCPTGTASPPNPEAVWQACRQQTVDRGFCLVPGCKGGSPKPGTPPVNITMATTQAPPMTRYMRLPTSVLPVHYSVELEPRMYEGHVDNFTFRGSVDILMKCVEATNNITVHMKGLSLVNSSIALSAADGAAVPAVVDYDVDRMYDFLVLNLDGQLEAGREYHIYMDFSAPLSAKQNNGFYITRYQENGTAEYLALTQFETTHARQAFPCFDEPALKATYDVTLVRRNDHSALSNMPVIRSEPRGSNMTADIFNTTVKMSTYILAFVVSKFSHKLAQTPRGIEIGVWTRQAALSTADYALDFGPDVLHHFEGFYNNSYQLPKLDMLATPVFNFGAMENWGMVIYIEPYMLYDPAVNSATEKQIVAFTISHEISHQWFGNLVTSAWWENIWLTEGFATLESYRGVDFVHPEWKMWETFIVDSLHGGYQLDETKSSNPLNFPVVQPGDIKTLFTDSRLVYFKAASVLRMFEHFMGKDTFWTGVKAYLKTHAYESVTYHDLADSLETARVGSDGGISIKEILETWILQMNYPVVTITRSDDHAFTVSQARFVLNSDAEESERFSSPYGYKWDIPFTYTTNLERDFNTSRTVLMEKETGIVHITDNSVIPKWNNNNSWVIGNVREVGFYRVNYDTAGWEALIDQLNTDLTVISPENRAQLINDAWNLVKANLTDINIALRLTEFLENDESYISWKAAEKELDYVDQRLGRTEVYGVFRKFMKSLVTKQYMRLGFNLQNSHTDRLLHPIIVKYACRYDVTECVTEARRLFAEWMTNETVNPVPPALKAAVYCTAVAHGGEAEWDFAHKIFRMFLPAELQPLYTALKCSRSRWILLRYLNDGPTDSVFGPLASIRVLASTPLGSDLVWEFIQRNWDKFTENIIQQTVSRLLVTTFNTRFDLLKLQRVLSEHQMTAEKTALETAHINVRWMENHLDLLAQFLHTTNFT